MTSTETLPHPRPGAAGELGGDLRFEEIGVDRIDERDRVSSPWLFFGIQVGSAMSLGSVIFGWIAITLGLGIKSALSSIVVGTLVGLLLILPLIAIGSRTATNNSTSSGAHFGVRGRLVGSFIGLAITVVFTAIAIWTGGDAIVAAFARLFDTPNTDGALAIAYAATGLLVFLTAVYGYHLVVRVEVALFAVGGLILALMLVAFAGELSLSYKGGGYLLGDFWKTWLLSVVAVGIGGPLAYVTYLGDYTRYISPSRHPLSRLLPIGTLGIFLALTFTSAVGALVAVTFDDPFADFVPALVSNSPEWFVIALLPLAIFGTLGFATVTVYSAGLDLDAIFPRLTRARATVIASAFSVALVYLGSLIWDAQDSILAVSLILLAISAPWAAVTGIGFLLCRGRYLLDDLQVFNRRQRGGAYWFSRGWNWRAVAAWAAGAAFGVLAINSTLYTGPLANIADGVDLSFVGSFTIAGVLYVVFRAAFPEPPTHDERGERSRTQADR